MTILLRRYRKAPEFPYPAGIDDCYNVTKYVIENARELKFDADRIALAGDSSGKKRKLKKGLALNQKLKT